MAMNSDDLDRWAHGFQWVDLSLRKIAIGLFGKPQLPPYGNTGVFQTAPSKSLNAGVCRVCQSGPGVSAPCYCGWEDYE